MDEIQELMFKEALLVQELELIRAKLKFVRLLKSEPQRGSSSSDSKNQKPENVGTFSLEHTRVNPVPFPKPEKTASIPEQTAPGKETTNPLTVDNLPKIMTEVQTSTTLVKPSDLILKPNGGIPIPIKTKDSALVIDNSIQGCKIPPANKTYYVVFNGPNAGIYQDWSIAKKASDGVPNIVHKKFKTFLEAKTSADIYTRNKLTEPLHLVCTADTLRPNNFVQALESKRKKQVSLGKLPVKIPKALDESKHVLPEINLADFEILYRNARIAEEQMFVDEHYFTTDSKNLSYYNFVQNANPEQIFETFQYGLVKQIYPSINLQEIGHFPKSFISAVKNFRKKCVSKPNTDIFLKINSSIPVWNNEGDLSYTPHHLIQIGICKELKYLPSKKMDCKIEGNDLKTLAKRRLEDFCNKTFNFFADSKIFINYFEDKILMYSKSGKQISGEDDCKFFNFQRSIARPYLFGSHFEDLCKIFKDHSPTYSCERCFKQQVDSTTKNDNAFSIIKEDSETTTGPSKKNSPT